jgi:hypothetical protein
MKSASLIKYDIHTIKRAIESSDRCSDRDKLIPRLRAKLAKKEADLVIATRRELKRLAHTLTFKADIYGPTGRIHSHELKWTVRDNKLFHGDKEIDPATLCDGHGRLITWESGY